MFWRSAGLNAFGVAESYTGLREMKAKISEAEFWRIA